MDDPTRALEFLKQLEQKNSEIVNGNKKIVNLDKKRNEAREALRALEKSDTDKTVMILGPMFVKLNKSDAQSILKNDCKEADAEIDKIRSDLNVKFNELRDMKREPPFPGLSLKAVNENELKALGVRK